MGEVVIHSAKQRFVQLNLTVRLATPNHKPYSYTGSIESTRPRPIATAQYFKNEIIE